MWKKFWAKISSLFISGLITLLPLFITIWLIRFLYTFLDGLLGSTITLIWGYQIPGLGLIAVVALIFIVGVVTQIFIGKQLWKLGEYILYRLPIIKNVYASAKQINDVLFMERNMKDKGFSRAGLVEYPRKGIWSIGFITSEAAKEIEEKSKSKLINIFIANTPTPVTGFLIMVPTEDVILLDMRVDQAFKYVVSGGVLKPNGTNDKTS